jgi:hypothetical protein
MKPVSRERASNTAICARSLSVYRPSAREFLADNAIYVNSVSVNTTVYDESQRTPVCSYPTAVEKGMGWRVEWAMAAGATLSLEVRKTRKYETCAEKRSDDDGGDAGVGSERDAQV